VKNSVLVPQGRMALLFEIETSGSGCEKKSKIGGGSPLLTISYKFLANTSDEKNKTNADQMVGRQLIFQHKLRLVRQPIDFVVECRHPQHTYKGKRVRFEWIVTCLRETKSKETKSIDESLSEFGERYSIKVDNQLWLIAAKANGYLDFDKSNSNPKSITKCTLIPLVSGILPLPQFRIETTSMARVKETNSKEDGITVYPSPIITSLCVKTEISDKMHKDYLFRSPIKDKGGGPSAVPTIVLETPTGSKEGVSSTGSVSKTPLSSTPPVSTQPQTANNITPVPSTPTTNTDK